MARKKRNVSRRSTAAVDVASSAGVESNADSTFSLVKAECERTVKESRDGKYIKALNMMKDLCSKYKNSPHAAFINRVQGTVFVNVASRTNDSKKKQQYYKNAVESARIAVSLSHNSIEFAHFYVNLLYEVANKDTDYDKVVQECERALAVENAVDPLKESLQDLENRFPISASCVLHIETELRSLIKKSNIASISIWMKNLANEDEKFELMPIRRIVEGKTLEDRKKEIEEKVAAARLLQKQFPHLGNEVNSSSHISRGLDSGPLERRKHGEVQRTVSSDDWREQVRPYWNSMSLDRKKDVLKVKFVDLQKHITALNDWLPSKVIVEALSFCKEKKVWHFKICCHCNKKNSEIGPFVKHIESVHMGIMPPKLQSVFPRCVKNEWVQMIHDRCWKPLDLNAAARILEERPLDFVDKESLFCENWPLSHDSQSAELLEQIQAVLRCLVLLEYLAESHINSISRFAVDELQNHPQLLKLDVHQTHLCICFFDAQQLLTIRTFLEDIAGSCEKDDSSASTTGTDVSNNSAQDAFMERIAFSQDDSVVVSIKDGCSDNGENSPETDAVLFWMYAGSLHPEEFAICTRFDYVIEEKAQKGLQIFQQLEREFHSLKVSSEEKLNYVSYQHALADVVELCSLAKTTKIMSETDFECQIPCYENVLRNRKQELIKTGTTLYKNEYELDAIIHVLEELASLGSGKADEYRVLEAVRSQGVKIVMEINKLDARMMSIHARRKHLFQELAYASKHDIGTILIPLLKYFLRARLEDLADKAILGELTPDSKSCVGSGVDKLKLAPERKNDSKKNKKSQKNRGPKVTNSDQSLGKTAEETLLPDKDCPSTEIAASVTNDDTDYHDLQLREEEYKSKLEAEERKLEEALEKQRQMEYEAKQKRLANQHESDSPAIRQEEMEIAAEAEHVQETLEDQRLTNDSLLDDEVHNVMEGAEDNTTDECMLSIIGSVNTRDILTDGDQRPIMPQKGNGYGSEQPTTGHHFPMDRIIPDEKLPETSNSGNKVIIKVNAMDVHETGLKIVLVEHNSFPSVIIQPEEFFFSLSQSLWHVRRFRDELGQRSSVHAHVGDSFLVCALCDIFLVPTTKEGEANPLRVALSKMLSRFFHKGPMNNASEVLEIILSHVHQLFTPSPDVYVTESVDSNHHKINMFKLDVFERMNCYHCGLQSRYRKYTSFFRKINANDLRKAKLMCPKYSFDELLNLVEMNHHLACDPEVSGCGALNHIELDLATLPHVFTAFLEWQNNSESVEDITQTLAALSTSIDVRFLYHGINTEHRHCLVSMVCYYGQNYCCFGYNEKDGHWILHDDKTMKVVGGWNDVVIMCKTQHMEPNVLFYEAVY